ncbi:hypothetical protein NIGALANA_214 [Bacillus phage Nigalana]|uniref:hypothetical protein n=1 Tax=Bacillus phage Nigalana TaxID=1805951 RepID=UPI0007A77108|nr:hypothetical protein BI005_gp214 [Bacillus phage Nigalana]AMW61363.1 hypothetical protein NIGALANA_214 [Bacillus phage Nigalana]ASR78561.1 hypothetical protein BUBS_217 [Bacillus phage Bubs]AXQ67424.1 hypothetical protein OMNIODEOPRIMUS_214 [Bacillus phage OmnioDeoPrimus]
MEIKETLANLNQEIANTTLKLGAKSREQSALVSKLADNSEEIIYLTSILNQYNDDRARLERMKRIADAERKITDLDCTMLKMGARLT